MPAYQGLYACDPVRAHLDLRLIVEAHLAVLDGVMESGFVFHALLGEGLHAVLVTRHAATSGILGGIHGQVRIPQYQIERLAIPGKTGNAHAAGDEVLQCLQAERLLENFHDPPTDVFDLAPVSAIRNEHRELVAAESRHGIHVPDATCDTLTRNSEQSIADTVSFGIIHLLEPVKIDIQDVAGATDARRPRYGLIKALPEELPIWQSRQIVKMAKSVETLALSD
jgi:hypothetical protein